jgi:hypothetical protein
MLNKKYLLTPKLQLIDLNEDSLNFEIEFSVTTINNEPFYISVVDQQTLDNGNDLEFKYVDEKTISGNIIQDDNIYQNYFLCLKSDNNSKVEVEIDKKIIRPSQESLMKENYLKQQENHRKMQEQHVLKQNQMRMQEEQNRRMQEEQNRRMQEEQNRRMQEEQMKMKEEKLRRYEIEREKQLKKEYQHIQQEKNILNQQKYQQDRKKNEIERNFKNYQKKINDDSNQLIKIKKIQEKENDEQKKLIEQKEIELKSKEQFLTNKDKIIKEDEKKHKFSWKKIFLFIIVVLCLVFLYFLLSKTNKNKHNFTDKISVSKNDTPLIDQSLLNKLNSIQVDI